MKRKSFWLVILIVVLCVCVLGIVIDKVSEIMPNNKNTYVSSDNRQNQVASNNKDSSIVTDSANAQTGSDNETGQTIQKDKHFIITFDDTTGIYDYVIYNSAGKVVDSGNVERMPPTISYITDNIIEIRFHGGTYADLCKYYNINTNTFSDEWWNPFLVEDDKIVYYNDESKNLIVQDIFDKNVFFRAFSIDMFPTGAPNSIEFLDAGQQLKITYMRPSDYEDETQIFNLN